MRIRKRFHAISLLIVLGCVVTPARLIAQCSSGAVCECPDCPRVERTYRDGRWFVLETANFKVCCEESTATATHLARHAEPLQRALRAKWLGNVSIVPWNPKCQIVLHKNQRGYVAAVGRGSERTVGSSLVSTDKGRITKRRIDLLGGSVDYLSAALPHELTHVVLRDRFTASVVPRWADEGMAILADTSAKQRRHFNDLQDARARRTTFHAAELLTMEDYPSAKRFGAFYGQSVSLTKFLVARRGPAEFVAFLEAAHDKGYDSGLRECYGIDNAGELDRRWRSVDELPKPASDDEIVDSITQSNSIRRNSVSLASTAVSGQPSGE